MIVKVAIVLGLCAAFVVAWAVASIVLHCILVAFCEFAESPESAQEGAEA